MLSENRCMNKLHYSLLFSLSLSLSLRKQRAHAHVTCPTSSSLVARRLVLSVASRRNRGEKSPDKTRRLRIVRPVAFNGACTMRVHKRRRVHPMHPSYGILAPRTQRVVFSLSPSLSLSVCFPFSFISLSILEDSPPSTRLILNPFVCPVRSRGCETARSAAVHRR